MSEADAYKKQVNDLRNQLEEKRKKGADKRLLDYMSDVTPLSKHVIRCRKTLKGHLAKVYWFDWDQNSQSIVSASQDGKLIVWNCLSSLKIAAIPLKSSWVMTVAFSPDGNFVVCGGLDNMCTVYDLMGNESKPRIKREFSFHEGYISSCVFLDTNRLISASGDSNLALWDIEGNKRTMTLSGHTSDVMRACMKPCDNNVIATCSCDRTCRIWDVRIKYPCVQIFSTHEEDINCVVFHPNSYVVGTASDDGSCRLYDLTADNEICVMKFESNNAKVGCTGLTFSISGRLMFVAQEDNLVCIRDTLRGDVVGKLSDHDNRISCIAVAPNGSALCTASWDNLLRVYA